MCRPHRLNDVHFQVSRRKAALSAWHGVGLRGGQVRARDTLETAHRLREHCSSVFRYAIAEGADLRDSCHDIRNALKRPSVRHFAGITKPAELTGLLRAIDNYSGTLCVRSAVAS